MIIKARHFEGWVIYDGFSKVHWFDQWKEEGCEPSQFDAVWGNSGNNIDVRQNENKKAERRYFTIIAKKSDDTEFCIIAHDDVYLLADNGKTIEKIN